MYHVCTLVAHSALQSGVLTSSGSGHRALNQKWFSVQQLWAQLVSWFDAVDVVSVRPLCMLPPLHVCSTRV